MAERINADLGLIDGLTADLGGPRTGALLDKLARAIDWDALAAPVRQLPEYNNGRGRKPWCAVMMIKGLMLAKWFNLSDPQLEECLQDRLSFRRFLGLSLTDNTPDETTFVVFRRRLREAGLHEVIFEHVVAQLDERGLLVHDGTAVDATIIEQSRGVRPGDPEGGGSRDADAGFTRKNGRTSFGYKGHAAADRSGIVVRCAMTPANEHDGHVFDELTEHEHKAVFADALYDSGARRASLRERGVIDGIVYRRKRNQRELRPWQSRWNTLVAPMRSVVEHSFATLKQQMGMRRVRYRGLERNAFDFTMSMAAANIRRSLALVT